MKKKSIAIIILCILAVLCTFVFTGCTKLNENMLPTNGNGSFTQKDIDELDNDFILTTASTVSEIDSVFTSLAASTLDADANELSVNTTTPGYASIGKQVKLTGGCYYLASYVVKINSIADYTTGVKGDGIYFSILEDDQLDFTTVSSLTKKEDAQDFVKINVAFKAKETGDATLQINFGSEEHPSKIEAVLSSFSVMRVNKKFINQNSGIYAGIYQNRYYGEVKPFNIFYIVMGAVCIAFLCLAAYIMLRRHYALSSPEATVGYKNRLLVLLGENNKLGIIFFICLGVVIRLLTSIISTAIAAQYSIGNMSLGYNIEGLASQAIFLAKYGPQYLLRSLGGDFATDAGYTVMSVSSSPLQLYFLTFAGLFGRIFEKVNVYMATVFFIRFFASLADIGAAYILYSLIKKQSGQIGAIIIASLYLCLPVVFAASSLWGYMESITAFLIILTVKFMLDNKYIPTAITFFVAFMFSQSALFIAPFVLFYTVLVCIKSVTAKEYKNLIAACCILVLSFFVYYALSVPFAINYIHKNQPFYWFTYSWNELYTGALYTINAFNFQAMLGNNLTEVTTASLIVTIIFILFMLSLAGLAYFKFKNRMNLVLLMTAFINMLFVFGNNMKPISIYISLILMLMYAIMNKEKRIFFCFVVFAILTFVNVSYCELMLNYTSTMAPNWYGKKAIMYVFSSFEIIAALYYVYVVYDIVVSRKVRKITPLAMTFMNSIKNFFLRIKKKYYKFKLDHKRA